MLKVLFFAQTRELIGVDRLDIKPDFATAEELRRHLAAQNEKWALALEKGKLLVAVNQTLSPLEASIKSGDQIAFFPQMTGG